MSRLDHEIYIGAPPERVWKVLADLEAVQHYNPGVAKAQYLSSIREGVGASRQCDLKPTGSVKERVIGWEPLQAITMELVESPWPVRFMRWRTALRSDGIGTRVTQQMEYRLKFGPLGTLIDLFVMKRTLNKTVSDIFVSMKRFIETGAGPSQIQ